MSSNRAMLEKMGICWNNKVISPNQKSHCVDCVRELGRVLSQQFLIDVLSRGNGSLPSRLHFVATLWVRKLL